jgi:hypothetical protein
MVAFDAKEGSPEFDPCTYQVLIEDTHGGADFEGDCGAEVEQVYDHREQTEGYFVMRGVNW